MTPRHRLSLRYLLRGLVDVRGDVRDLLLAQRVAERRHRALAVRDPVDDERLGGLRASSEGPTFPVDPAAESVWQPPQPALANTSAPPPRRR